METRKLGKVYCLFKKQLLPAVTLLASVCTTQAAFSSLPAYDKNTASLYTVDPETAAITNPGTISGLQGVTVGGLTGGPAYSAVPEPGTYACLGISTVGFYLMFRRRRLPAM